MSNGDVAGWLVALGMVIGFALVFVGLLNWWRSRGTTEEEEEPAWERINLRAWK